jgi:hypothetical protein
VSGDPQAAEDAFNVAGAAMTGGLLAPRPRNSLGTFGGVKAKTADHDALARAQQMEAQGVDRDAVWRETGWGKGVDGEWRFEIDDSATRIGLTDRFDKFDDAWWGESISGPMSNVLRGVDKNAYPDLAAESAYLRKADPVSGVRYPGNVHTIQAEAPDANSAKSVLLHEYQHGIQRKEGFAVGGSPKYVTPEEVIAERDRLLTKAMSGLNEDEAVYGPMSRAVSREDIYNRLAGEVEARAVQTRMNMTPEERRARPFWYDYDVPENQQIVNFYANGGRPGALAGLLSGYGYQQQQPNQLAADWTRNLRPGDI